MEDLIQNNSCRSTKASYYHSTSKTFFSLPDSRKQSEFLKLYLDSVQEGTTPAISEIFREYIPLVLRFRFLNKDDGIQVDDARTWMIQVGNYVQNIISRNFVVSPSAQELIFTLQDDATEAMMNSYHATMFFPFFRLKRERMDSIKATLISDLERDTETPDQYEIECSQPMNEIISIPKSDKIPMFGANIRPNTRNIVGAYGKATYLEPQELDFEDFFDPSHHRGIGPIVDERISYYLPLLFTADMPHTIEEPLKNSVFYNHEDLEDEEEGLPEELQNASRYLSMISKERFTKPGDMEDIGLAIYRCSYGSEEGLELWKNFCHDLEYEEDYYDEKWDEFDSCETPDRITEMTLQYMAMKDNPKKYNDYREKVISQYIQCCVNNPLDEYMAEAFYQCFPFSFMCTNYKSGLWYHYKDNSWLFCDDTVHIIRMIKDKFTKIIEKYHAQLTVQASTMGDGSQKLAIEQQCDLAKKLINKLRTYNGKMNLCKELKSTKYYREDFEKTRDTVPYLFAMKNCVVDLRGGKATIREGRPEDYITMKSKARWCPHYHWNHSAVKMVTDYLDQVFPNKSVNDWMRAFLSSRLYKRNSDKIFPMWTGEGDNSKSIFVSLIEKAFYHLSGKGARGMMSKQKNDSNGASPALVSTRGKNIVFFQEPNENEPFESATIKEITGSDTMWFRDLFQKGSEVYEIMPTFVPILIANRIPHMPDCQQAIWNRVRVIPFESTWVDNVEKYLADHPEKEGKVFKKDSQFDQKLPKMINALLWVAIMGYENYAKNGLPHSDIVMSATEKYRYMNNYFEQFVQNEIEKGDQTDMITGDEMFKSFQSWYKKQNIPQRCPMRKAIIDGLRDVLGKNSYQNDTWIGVTLKTLHLE